MKNAFTEKLERIIREEYPNIDKLDEDTKSQLFFHLFTSLVEVMKRDFSYALQIVEKK